MNELVIDEQLKEAKTDCKELMDVEKIDNQRPSARRDSNSFTCYHTRNNTI